MGEPLVRASGLGRSYGHGAARVEAVRAATFAIDDADTIAVVGPSGSGKSTLLHLIAGLDQPSAGSIAWPAIGDRAALRPGPIGIAFQGPSLLPPLTVVENVALPAILAGDTDTDARRAALELLETFGAARPRRAAARGALGGPGATGRVRPRVRRIAPARARRRADRTARCARRRGADDGGAHAHRAPPSRPRRRDTRPRDRRTPRRRWVMRDGTLHREAVPSSA